MSKDAIDTPCHASGQEALGNSDQFQTVSIFEDTNNSIDNDNDNNNDEENCKFSKLKCQSPTSKLNFRQYLYIFVFHGLGNAVISGGINAAINYGMNVNSTEPNMAFWGFPVGGATSLIITVLAQSFLVYFIIGMIICNDIIRNGKPCAPYEPSTSNYISIWTKAFPRIFFGLCCYNFRDFVIAVFAGLIFMCINVIIVYLPTIAIMGLVTLGGVNHFSFDAWYIFISLYTAFIGYFQAAVVAYIGLIACSHAIRRKSHRFKQHKDMVCSMYDDESLNKSILSTMGDKNGVDGDICAEKV